MAESEIYRKGQAVRRQLLGDAHVDRINQTVYADPVMQKFIDLATETAAIRRKLGVVFQSPAVDKKLTVRENLRYGGLLVGLSGKELAARIDGVLAAGRLGAGTEPVGAVASAVGYESEAAFCRAFKKVTGVTPAAWRGRRARRERADGAA